MDTLDECPNTSEVPLPRNQIFQLLEELAQIPDPHIYVTSCSEFDKQDFLKPLTSHQVSLLKVLC
jgi:hypothetical protein